MLARRWKEIALAIAVLLLVGQWTSGLYADRRLEKLRATNEAASAEIALKVDALTVSMADLTTENVRLRTSVVRPLEQRLGTLTRDLAAARELHETSLTAVDALSTSDVTRETTTRLDLDPDQVRVTSDGSVLFSADAARANLRYLLEGENARNELMLTVQKVVTLEALLTTEREFGRNQSKIIEDLRARESLTDERYDLRVEVLEAEVASARRARLRRISTYLAVGVVTGVVLGSR